MFILNVTHANKFKVKKEKELFDDDLLTRNALSNIEEVYTGVVLWWQVTRATFYWETFDWKMKRDSFFFFFFWEVIDGKTESKRQRYMRVICGSTAPNLWPYSFYE